MDREVPTPSFGAILAPVDGTAASEIAVRRSRALLSLPGCRLTLLHVDDDGDLKRVEALASEARDWGADVQIRLREGRPAREILEEIRSGGHDLVLMTSRRRSRMSRAIPGTIALRVLRRSPVPLLLYRPLSGLDEAFFATERSEPASFRRILLMLDGSEEALRIVAPARQLARAFHSELIFFHAVPPRSFGQERMNAARAYLARQADEVSKVGFPSRLQIVVGEPVEEALRALEATADTIALSTRGASAWRSAALGSTAAALLAKAEGPVLVLSSHPEPARIRDYGGRLAGIR